eukprot:UN24376
MLILKLYNHFSGPTKLKTSAFFWYVSKFSEIALNFKENLQIFHLQRPQNFPPSAALKFSTFSGPKIFHFQRP